MSTVVDVTDSTFDAEVLNAGIAVLVDFWAPWCGPCKSIAPVLEEIAKEYSGRLKVCKVNVDDNKEHALKFNVRGIPNLIIFNKDGNTHEQIVGAVAKHQLVAAISKVV